MTANELTTFYNFAIIGLRSDCGNVFVERQGWKVKKYPQRSKYPTAAAVTLARPAFEKGAQL